MPWRDTLLFSLSLFLGSLVSLPLSLSDSPSGHTINCQPRTSLPMPPLLFASLPLPIARVTDVEEGNTERKGEGECAGGRRWSATGIFHPWPRTLSCSVCAIILEHSHPTHLSLCRRCRSLPAYPARTGLGHGRVL